MRPTISPTFAMSLVLIRPVEQAMAFGGVEIGSSIAIEVEAATQTSYVVTPPKAPNCSLIAVPTTAKIGTNKLAADELAMKLESSHPSRPAMMSTAMADYEPNGIDSTRAAARPVLLSAVPIAKPPATIQSTCQSIFAKSSRLKIPTSAKTANGISATTFELR